MNYWIFVVNDWKDEQGINWDGEKIFNILKTDKVWGIGHRTPNRNNLAQGDKVAFYLAGPERKKFIGYGTVKSKCVKFTKDTSYSKDTNRIVAGWGSIVAFEEIEAFDQYKMLQDLAESLEFIVRKDKAANYFQGGVRSITMEDYERIKSEPSISVTKQGAANGVEDETQFVLEKYLQDFIVSNWDSIDFGKKLKIFKDNAGNSGSQYTTDAGYIDILAIDDQENFVVIELKKGRESDRVVGQTLRYMGWVKEHLAKKGQQVEGLIICKENDQKMAYAIDASPSITIKHYVVNFKLLQTPPDKTH